MLVGTDLSEIDYRDLETRWINRTWAQAAALRKVDHFTGKELVQGRKGDYSGIAIPYFLPGDIHEITYRLRRFNPEIDERTHKARGKYVAAPTDRNHVYFPPHCERSYLTDTSIPLIITEGEFKAIAMRRLASEALAGELIAVPRFLPIALSGIWNWRGVVGAMLNMNGVRVPLKGVIPDLDLLLLLNRKVIIAFDMDQKGLKREVRIARHQFSIELRSRGANVGYLEWDPEKGKGPDDWIAMVGPAEVLAAIAQVEYNTATGWEAQLLCHDTGKPKASTENARLAVSYAPEFVGIALDEFSGRIVRPPTVPWPGNRDWTDCDSIELSCWLHRKHIEVGKDAAYDAVQVAAARNRFNPVRNYLESLEWDGEPRVDTWLSRYVGVAPSNYAAAAGRCWLLSAVARIFEPGCKVDVALLLIGPQGVRKSTVCRILGEPWFSDNLPDVEAKGPDAPMHLRGHWILELSELAALGRAAITTVNSFMSRIEDIYRPSYGRAIVHQPRQCVFIATTNEAEPLKDATGNRRFWPVEVGTIDAAALLADKDQVWAEAVELYRAGATWHFTDERIVAEAKREQAARLDLPVWFEPIRLWCANREMVTISEILHESIHKEKEKQTQADKVSVVRCLQSMGWQLGRRRINGLPTKVYLNPEWLED